MSHLNLELDEVLALISPLPNGENNGKNLPSKALRTTWFGEESERFEDTPLTLVLRSGEEEIHITGNADGIEPASGTRPHTVEEEILLDRMVDFDLWRDRLLLRARFLALALANTKGVEQVKIRLSAFAEGRVEREEFLAEKSALSEALAPTIRTILSLAPLWARPELSVAFPYETLRDGQKELIHRTWDAIKDGTRLFACAPTGIGKTLAVLYPALRALETGKADRVYYASPKNTLKQQAAEAVESLQSVRGLRTLVLSAKMSLCPEKKEDCKKEECPYGDPLPSAVCGALSYLAGFSCITAKELESASKAFSVCPFHLATKMQRYCRVIIGDYNHIFDPLRAIFPPESRSILLVDEAHNLPTRIRESYTQTLSPTDLDFFFRDPSSPSQMLREHLAPLATIFTRVEKERNESKEYFSFQAPDDLAEAAKELLPKVGFALHGGFGPPSEETEAHLKEFYGKLKKFCSLYQIFDADFATVYPPEGGCRIYLVNPREKIRSASRGWKSAIFFSATLLPEDYYFRLLGGDEEDSFLNLPSPFAAENLFVGICGVDVSYSQRFATAPKLCSIIHSAVSVRPGNYMVFLPSFEYLTLVSQEYKRRFFDHRVLIQEKVMTGQKRASFIRTFRENRQGTLIGFCVMGGVFAEGLDLKGDSLSGEIIVGTGFPPPSPEAEAECAAYYKKEMDGKSLAYTLPGWSRVLQAAGRVIRDEEDRGFVILCDNRYLGEDIKELFPDSWDHAVLLERDAALKKELEQFWK